MHTAGQIEHLHLVEKQIHILMLPPSDRRSRHSNQLRNRVCGYSSPRGTMKLTSCPQKELQLREEASRWVGQAGDGERRESPRASGGWMKNGNEGYFRTANVAGEKLGS